MKNYYLATLVALVFAWSVQADEPEEQIKVPYGNHKRQVLDFYPANSKKPTPVFFWIHGGSWMIFDKAVSAEAVKDFNDNGISVISINYRYIKNDNAKNVIPPVKAPLSDAARALQFIRSKAKEWNIDKKRISASGHSAGGYSALWLAMHDDMADPNSNDPIARESTRVDSALVVCAQVSLDPKELLEWMPNYHYGPHAFGMKSIQQVMENREQLLPWINEYSPSKHASRDDPPIALFYTPGRKADTPDKIEELEKGDRPADPTHSLLNGALLEEIFRPLGGNAKLILQPGKRCPNNPTQINGKTARKWLIDRLTR